MNWILGLSIAVNAFAAFANFKVYRANKSQFDPLVVTSHVFVDDFWGEIRLPPVVPASWLNNSRVRFLRYGVKCNRSNPNGPTPCLGCAGPECHG